jgi:hypothetical protein
VVIWYFSTFWYIVPRKIWQPSSETQNVPFKMSSLPFFISNRKLDKLIAQKKCQLDTFFTRREVHLCNASRVTRLGDFRLLAIV